MHSFRKVLISIAVYLAAVSAASASLMEPYFNSSVYHYQDASVRRELAGTIDTVFIGASHGLRAFSPEIADEILDISSYNLSTELMTMRGRYTLLKKELSRNPVKTVILELSFNSLTRNRIDEGPEGDIYVFGKLDTPAERAGFFFSAFRPDEYARVYSDTLGRGATCITGSIEPSVTDEIRLTQKGFLDTGSNDVSMTEEQYENNRLKSTIYSEPYAENVEYLERIIKLCHDYGVRIITVVTPISDRTICMYSDMDVLMNDIASVCEENGVEYYDFNLLKTRSETWNQETDFSDDIHLSVNGAEKFTKALADVLIRINEGGNTTALFFKSYKEISEADVFSFSQ